MTTRMLIAISTVHDAGIGIYGDYNDLECLRATIHHLCDQPRTRIRVLTTTYTGAAEQEALDYLARLPGCQVKFSLDGRPSRLHAKAWIFHRRTGFGSAYAGSANLCGVS
jgi:HKD family nuclease